MDDMEAQREAQRAWVRETVAETGLDVSNLAKRAGVVASTLTRFMNNPDYRGLLRTDTWVKLQRTRAALAKEREASRAGLGQSIVLQFPNSYPTPSREELEDLLKDPEMWMWLAIFRTIKKEDRAKLSTYFRRGIVPMIEFRREG